MVKGNTLIIATLAAASATGGARAADLLPPPPPIEAPPPAEFGGWYLRGDAGVGAVQISGWKSTLQPYDELGNPLAGTLVVPAYDAIGDQAFAGAGFGYQFNNWLRGDLTAEYRTEANYRAGLLAAIPGSDWYPGFLGADYYTAGVSSLVVLANGYIDLGHWCGVTPFVGAGVGFVNHKFAGLTDSGLGFGTAADKYTTNFAWSVTAGVGLSVTPNLKLEVAYRYLDMGNIGSNPIQCLNPQGCFQERHSFYLASNDIRVGFRYLLGGPPPPPALPPVVAKY
ncbi:MAG TPA: outer membrane beta-barrel protein [Methylocystis sp.]|nr:outer membrane beta-barrel protein [Methylocystis sp.]